MSARVRASALGLALFLLLITGWHFMPAGGLAPTPAGVWHRAIEILSDPFYRDGPGSVGIFWHLLTSLHRVLTGFFLAAAISIPLGFLLGRLAILRWAVDPLVQILRPVSPLAWLPIGLALLHDAERTAVFVIVVSALWPLLLNTIDAVLNIHPSYLKLTRTLRTPLWLAVTQVWVPATLPGIITGLRLSLSTSWLVIIAAEMLVGGQGIGFYVWTMWNRLDIDAIVVAIVLIGLTGLVLDHLVAALQRTVRLD